MGRSSEAEWRRWIAQWRSSGVSATEFGRRIGKSESTIRWWASRLRSTREAARTAPLTFVEVTSAVRSEPIEVVLASGVRLRVAADFDADALERVLAVLEKRR